MSCLQSRTLVHFGVHFNNGLISSVLCRHILFVMRFGFINSELIFFLRQDR